MIGIGTKWHYGQIFASFGALASRDTPMIQSLVLPSNPALDEPVAR